jgi:hypothetical protein
MSTTAWIVIILITLGALAGIAWMLWDGRRKQLRKRFGPEYERVVARYGDRRRAEGELRRREKRRESFDIRPLSPAEYDRFSRAWRWDQSHFVDHPDRAVEEAHQLVTKVMEARGYPVSDFEQQAADISVDHPAVVQSYHRAYGLYQRYHHGAATTEDLRTAMIYYRELFEELLDRPGAAVHEIHSTERGR